MFNVAAHTKRTRPEAMRHVASRRAASRYHPTVWYVAVRSIVTVTVAAINRSPVQADKRTCDVPCELYEVTGPLSGLRCTLYL